MGGNIFKCRRISTEEYNTLKDDLYKILTNEIYGRDMSVNFIPFVKEKQSHGDIDIVIGMEECFANSDHIKRLIEHVFKDLKVTSKNTLSVLYKQVQVDLIIVPSQKVDYAVKYFAYNDLGNLIGRIAKQLGFKHGHLGLFYKQMYNTSFIKEYTLSNNFNDILNILKLDIQTHKNGFDTYHEMFNYVISSPYFNKNIFLYENLNHRNRLRDKKRKTYNMFLSYIDTIPDKQSEKLVSNPLYYIHTHFPHIREPSLKKYSEYVEQVKARKEIISFLSNPPYSFKDKQLGDAAILLRKHELFKLPLDTKQINNLLKVKNYVSD